MKIRIAVGDIDIRLDGVDLTPRQIRSLIKYSVAASTAIALTTTPETEETDSKTPLGFSATIERLPEEIVREDLSWYFE